MEYTVIVNFIFGSLIGLCGLLVTHYVVFGVLGLFAKKTFEKTDVRMRYGILVSARNEEAVIGGLLDSIKKNDYPEELIDVFVIAHNCTDKTAEVAAEHGAIVYVYNNPNEKTKGYALKYLFERIEEKFGTQNYDGFFIMDADNVLAEDYLLRMNEAFVATNKQNVITSFRNSKNFGYNLLTAMYGLYFVYGCRMEARGRTLVGCSTRVAGTGYLIPSETVKDGWKYLTLCEDWEFTADQLLSDKKIIYCDDAMFYDEQPTKLSVMFKQRLRWAKGHFLVCMTRFTDIVKGLFKRKKKGGSKFKGSLYDFSVNIAPIGILTLSLSFLQIFLLCLSPLFGDYNIWRELLGYFITVGTGLGSTCLLTVVASFIIYFLERKRIPKVGLFMKIVSALIWPIFVLIAIPLEFISIFVKNMGWTPIPHGDKTRIDQLSLTGKNTKE